MKILNKTRPRKTFVLGLGAQKSGTSWLHHYLQKQPGTNLGKYKEYKIWDAIDLPLFRRFRVPSSVAAFRQDPLRFCMQRCPNVYFYYFTYLLKSPHTFLSADISPSYAGLNSSRLSMIKRNFQRRKVDVRAVFFMREPLARCASLVDMWRPLAKNGVIAPDPAFLDLYSYCQTEHARILTGYDFTLEQMETAFRSHERYCAIYEEMFSDQKMEDLFSFLNIPADLSMRDKRVHAAERKTVLSEADYERLAPIFRSAYENVATRFPQVVRLWRGFSYL